LGRATAVSEYSTRADWTTVREGTALRLTNLATGGQLGIGTLGLGSANATITPVAATTGCFTAPDSTVTYSGTPGASVDGDGNLVGLVDAHIHITAADAFGGGFRCGTPFAAGGITQALAPCPTTHGAGTKGSIFENLIAGTSLTDTADDGWPTFSDWPTPHSLLHEQAYFRSIERAWRAGLRVMNALLVENRVICTLYDPLASCDEMDSIRRQAAYVHEMQDYIDAQSGGPGKGFFRIVTTPAQLRQVVAEGKLAVTLGTENSELFGCTESSGCDEADVDAGLDELQSLGVMNVYPVHKFDNAFGGTRFDSDGSSATVNLGNLISSGHWWQAEKCDSPHDNEQSLNDDALESVIATIGGGQVPAGTVLPVYPSGNICNVRGLTDLGAYFIRQLIKRGMVINIDHMGVKTAEATLDIAEAEHYAGIASAHTWSDRSVVNRILGLGGMVSSYAFAAGPSGVEDADGDSTALDPSFVSEWRANNALPNGSRITGYGYGSDTNGLGAQPDPRDDAATDPLTYPFTAPSGVTMGRQTVGQRTFDINSDGVAQYGLFADWYADLLHEAGPDASTLRGQLMDGAEAYVRSWEAAQCRCTRTGSASTTTGADRVVRATVLRARRVGHRRIVAFGVTAAEPVTVRVQVLRGRKRVTKTWATMPVGTRSLRIRVPAGRGSKVRLRIRLVDAAGNVRLALRRVRFR
ncbi:MAG: hypothetical protein QM572_01565, partial [Nocardioides sp.]|uniref:hypothetical protein n=1 Tax=Nocardioides sp. TaxID=35761 RepID=UPI0039E63CA8